jgi:hypothetical protein
MTNSPHDSNENAAASKLPYPESPVPGDDNLPDDELPFTAFGQFGEGSFDLRVFEQAKYWVNEHGEPFLLDEMDSDYLYGVVEFLFNGAEFFYVAMVNRVAVEIMFMENDLKAEERIFNRVRSVAVANPVEWLNNTVLMRKLHELLDSQ